MDTHHPSWNPKILDGLLICGIVAACVAVGGIGIAAIEFYPWPTVIIIFGSITWSLLAARYKRKKGEAKLAQLQCPRCGTAYGKDAARIAFLSVLRIIDGPPASWHRVKCSFCHVYAGYDHLTFELNVQSVWSAHDLTVYPFGSEFFVRPDGVALASTDEWSPDAIRLRVKKIGNYLTIYAGDDVQATVRVECFESEPPIDISRWDHVVEASLELASTGEFSSFQVRDINDESRVFFMAEHGSNRIRVCFSGLSAEGNVEAGEYRYVINVWPGPAIETRVVKQFA